MKDHLFKLTLAVLLISGILCIGTAMAEGPADSDSDGMVDSWEIEFFSDLNETADGDFDGDGHTNLEELEGGTNATDPLDFPGSDGDDDGNDILSLGIIIGLMVCLVVVIAVFYYFKIKKEKKEEEKGIVGEEVEQEDLECRECERLLGEDHTHCPDCGAEVEKVKPPSGKKKKGKKK